MSHHHDHHHGHRHTHGHHSHIPENRRILGISLLLIAAFMLLEFAAGRAFNSLTLLADAGHMANDALSLLLAWFALFLSARRQRFFALLNGVSLIFVALMILKEAFERWGAPQEMAALPMLGVAAAGLLVNLIVAALMMKGDHHNLNVKAAYLHVLADLLGSVAAIIAGLSAWLLGWQWVDIAASVLLSLFVLKSGCSVSREAWLEWRHG
ncbi:MAG: cation diffusion facilitator family transporter [Neisseria sp.]|nr:cation diffusion facilitator family transporter [Neisseria sp.]